LNTFVWYYCEFTAVELYKKSTWIYYYNYYDLIFDKRSRSIVHDKRNNTRCDIREKAYQTPDIIKIVRHNNITDIILLSREKAKEVPSLKTFFYCKCKLKDSEHLWVYLYYLVLELNPIITPSKIKRCFTPCVLCKKNI